MISFLFKGYSVYLNWKGSNKMRKLKTITTFFYIDVDMSRYQCILVGIKFLLINNVLDLPATSNL